MEFVDEGSINLAVTAEEGGEGGLVVESLEGAVSGHAEDDLGDVQVMNMLDIHSMNALLGPFKSRGFKSGVPLELVHVS